MNTNRWILIAIRNLQQLASKNSFKDIVEALDSVYDVAEFELASSLDGTPSVSAERLPDHADNVVCFPADRSNQREPH
ncbi:hypothetical protein [uncultured Tateyamaria sp.]|uniref:hypothetical protein n=1 Tax=uncultured Tateyamaria sp. TaxID=455651 RepID=UPI0026146FFD|nr:hypothetical protein [uncultured Tateyamaria sp.]